MANPRQRRKAKSSTHKAISHSKRAKQLQKKMPAIRGPKVLQDAWDPSKTIRQNYLAMGLQQDLKPVPSGGREVNVSHTNDGTDTRHSYSSPAMDDTRPTLSEASKGATGLPKGFGRIVRDVSGDVVRVELASDGEVDEEQTGIDTRVVLSESELRVWAHDQHSMEGMVVQDLENLAASETLRQRHTSTGERLYLERLVAKHGDDVDQMARDVGLNPWQRTAKELKRAIEKAGGLGVLLLCKKTGTRDDRMAGVAHLETISDSVTTL